MPRSPTAPVTTSTEMENSDNHEPQRLAAGTPTSSAQFTIPDQPHHHSQSQDEAVRVDGMIPTPNWHNGPSSNIPGSREQYHDNSHNSQPSPAQHLTVTPQEANFQQPNNTQGPQSSESTYIGRAHYLEDNIDENIARAYTASRADGLTTTELATLQIWNSFDVPPRSISQSLIEAFREYCFPWMPTVEPGELYLSQNQASSYLLMQSVFLAASRVSPSPGLAEYATSEQLYQRARALFWVAHEKDPLTVVKSITMLHWYNPDGPAHVSYDTSEYWLKIGVGLAYQIGLHKEPPHGPQRAVRRRIWWSLVVSGDPTIKDHV